MFISYCREKIKDIHIINLFRLLLFCLNGPRVFGEKRKKPPLQNVTLFTKWKRIPSSLEQRTFFKQLVVFFDRKILYAQLPATRTEFNKRIRILFGIKNPCCLITASCHCRRIFQCTIISLISGMVYWIGYWMVGNLSTIT
jgi:hypothetical protein